VGVLLRDGLNCGHQVACYGRREAETGLHGSGCNVDKRPIGDGLRAGVAEDDLSEKALGAVCFVGLEVALAIFNPAKRTTGVLRAEGTGAVKGDRREAKRNKWRGPACGE
jgi:hypothetical protein